MGFNDVANFRKAFRCRTGQTPSEIRREAPHDSPAPRKPDLRLSGE
ncbi:hypothetical protein [Roseiarcus sp.]